MSIYIYIDIFVSLGLSKNLYHASNVKSHSSKIITKICIAFEKSNTTIL